MNLHVKVQPHICLGRISLRINAMESLKENIHYLFVVGMVLRHGCTVVSKTDMVWAFMEHRGHLEGKDKP